MLKNRADRINKEDVKMLFEGCLRKDHDAWNKFISLTTPLVYYIIEGKFRKSGFSCRKSDIENLKQDIFLSIWKDSKLESVKCCDKIIPWICAFTANAASNHIRDIKPVDIPKANLLKDSFESSYPMPAEELSNKHIRRDIDSALKSLNHKENLIIKLSLFYGKRYREIAEILNVPLGTILVTAQRAKTKLKKRLKKYVIK